ncbi:putative intron-encoded DNA endonuclease 1 [Frankliniella fusca]|uniref:Intron-encoded DNA endonuclease 1 n=1 Tax=Frankliniella fusca TaxID=407009 RepID=A0AAE1HMX1_9NEOP|nr:putative intron-encoded DNA endonuclease 1 [Frankliniella fusca]
MLQYPDPVRRKTTEADKDRYAQATLRENNARKLGTAIRGLLAEQDDGQVVHIKCAHCKKGLTYMKTDATAAYIHHYGEYCTRPCALRGAPVATGSDKAAAGKLGEWRRSMEEMRDKALAQLMDQPAHWTTPTADTATSQPATPEPANPWANSRPLPSPPTSPGKRHFDGDGEPGTPFKTPRQKTDPNLCHGPATDHFDQDGALGNEDASAAADAVMEDDTGSQQGEMQHEDYTVLLERLKAADIEHTFRTPKTAATVRLVAKRLPVGIAESTVQEALGALQVRGVHRLTVPAAPGEGPRPRALTAAVGKSTRTWGKSHNAISAKTFSIHLANVEDRSGAENAHCHIAPQSVSRKQQDAQTAGKVILLPTGGAFITKKNCKDG